MEQKRKQVNTTQETSLNTNAKSLLSDSTLNYFIYVSKYILIESSGYVYEQIETVSKWKRMGIMYPTDLLEVEEFIDIWEIDGSNSVVFHLYYN